MKNIKYFNQLNERKLTASDMKDRDAKIDIIRKIVEKSLALLGSGSLKHYTYEWREGDDDIDEESDDIIAILLIHTTDSIMDYDSIKKLEKDLKKINMRIYYISAADGEKLTIATEITYDDLFALK